MDMRVWVGCLGCYNDGRLVGEWADAADADPVTMGLAKLGPEGGYRGPFCVRCGADEFWCLDQEGLAPFITGECSPMDAQRLALQVADLDDHDMRLLRLYVEAVGVQSLAQPIDWADVAEEARDHYRGEADTLADWAAEFADETGALDQTDEFGRPIKHGISDVILRNIDWAGVAEEWTEGFSTVRDDETGHVVLFSS